MKKSIRKLLALLLTFSMVMSLLCVSAYAYEETDGEIPQGTEQPTTPSDSDSPAEPEAPIEANEYFVAKIGDKTYDTLEAAVNAAEDGDTIELGAGNYTLYHKHADVLNKNLTFVGSGTDETTWQIGPTVPDPAKYGTEYNSDYSFDVRSTDTKETVTFKNMTLQSGKVDYLGFSGTDNTVVENCVVEGKTFYWGETSATFKNTTFNCPTGDYAFWTYGSHEYNIEGCIFNASGKIINVFCDASAGKYDIVVNFKDCTVNNSTPNKSVLNFNDSNMGDYKYILNISGDTTVSGVNPHGTTCSRLFGFSGSANNTGKTVVNIEDTTVWANGQRVGEHNQDIVGGSYDNGVVAGTDNKYTDGYKDNAFTIKSATEWMNGDDGKQYREVTKECKYCGETMVEKEVIDIPVQSWNVSNSKTATALDNNQSTVTLSLPSAEEQLVSDVVFVMDGSSCNEDSRAEFADMLTSLAEHTKNTDAKINVGIVMFRGVAQTYPLEELTSENIEVMKNKIVRPDVAGSNMHAGLLAAQEMLAQSPTDNSRKYIVLISDGITYTWDNGGIQYGAAIQQYVSNGVVYASNSDYELYHEGNLGWTPEKNDWATYLNSISAKIALTIAERSEPYTRDNSAIVKYIAKNEYDTYACSVDVALYKSLETWNQLAEKYNCYAKVVPTGQYGEYFMNYLADGKSADFTSIKNDILYAVAQGSTVIDTIGKDFDIADLDNFKMTVDGITLDKTIDTDNNVIYFGTEQAASETAMPSANDYRFKVEYFEGDDEHFVWTINEEVSNFAPVQLTYTVKLNKPETAVGTYGQLDLNGDGKIDNTGADVTSPLYTNESAILHPVDSKQNSNYEPVEFPKPSVSYTVSRSGGGGGGGSSTTYYTLNYESNGGTMYSSERYSSGTKVTLTKVPTRVGYQFSGWYEDSSLDKSISTVTMNSNKTVYAGWRASTVPSQLNGADHFAYVIGYTDGMVRPLANITRAETSTIFFRLLNSDIRDGNLTDENTFEDVLQDMWCNKSISTLAKLGIVKGVTATQFNPNAPITRAEFAAICARFDTGLTAGASNLTDISGHWAEAEIERAVSLGWIMGYPDGTFRPDQHITRAEAMTIINRVLCRIPEEENDLLDDMNVWPDNRSDAWYYLAVQEATNSHDFTSKGEIYEKWNHLTSDPDWTRYQ